MSEIWHSKKNDCRLSRTQVNRISPTNPKNLLFIDKTDNICNILAFFLQYIQNNHYFCNTKTHTIYENNHNKNEKI